MPSYLEIRADGVLECWEEELRNIPNEPVELDPQTTLYHGAKRFKEEHSRRNDEWLWADHWYSKDEEYSRCYTNPGDLKFTEIALITLTNDNSLKLADLSSLNLVEMCSKALNTYGNDVVGLADWPIRTNMKATLQYYLGNDYQGYMQYGHKEIFIFDFSDNLSVVKIEEIQRSQ